MNGIYIIHNTATNTAYIGQTGKDFDYRKKRHFQMLNGGYHSNRHLQNAWNKYGAAVFEFDILEELNTDDTTTLDAAEKFFIEYFRYIGVDLYNLAAVSRSSLGIKRSQTTKDKLSDVVRARWKNQEYRATILAKALPNLERTPERIAQQIEAVSKNHTLRSPDGECMTITNLKQFCRNNGLNDGAMYQVVKGKKVQYKGWTQCKAVS